MPEPRLCWVQGSPTRPRNSLFELTLDFMHCISESITSKSPSQAIWKASSQTAVENAGGGLGELYGLGFQSFIMMLFSVSLLRILKAHYSIYADKDLGLM